VNPLERRYRRLLALYPRAYRERYGQEMLGVLLDCAGPRRRRPTLREAANLVGGALAYRTRHALADLTTPQWRRAASVLAVLAPLAMLVLRLHIVNGVVGPVSGLYRDHSHLGPTVWGRPLAWAAVLVVVLAGWRRPAILAAWTALLLELATQGVVYHRFGADKLPTMVSLTLSAVAVAAIHLWIGGRPRFRAWHWAAVPAAALAVIAAQQCLEIAGGLPLTGGLGAGVNPLAVVVVVVVVVLVWADPPLRRRLAVVFGALVLLAVLSTVSDNNYVSYHSGPALLLLSILWPGSALPAFGSYVDYDPGLALVLLSTLLPGSALAAFGLGVRAIRRRERESAG
jgi:hypothetical protein